MGKGRKKIPTAIKKAQGTLVKSRTLENEMEVEQINFLPEAPDYLNDFGKLEWGSVAGELLQKNMLHLVDLSLLSAYCNEMGTYLECSEKIKKEGAVERTYDKDGRLRASKTKPEVAMARNALDRALKIAVQFGFTPSSRASIPQPETPGNKAEDYDFFG
jgi:P27 family predicted phage terminase small subunit